MCGRGDTVVVSEAGERFLERRRKTGTALYKKMRLIRTSLLERLDRLFTGRIVSLPTPFSDNLGLLLNGLPALQFTLLPHREAHEYKLAYKKLLEELAGLAERSPKTERIYRERFNAIQPETWRMRHTDRDTVASLDPDSFVVMEKLLEAIVKSEPAL
jgi:hypothetical protein